MTLGLVVMGPSACGKSEVAMALAEYYKCPFLDADQLHTEANIEKMRNGIKLTDTDRLPWLRTIRTEILKRTLNKTDQVVLTVACSALRKLYRGILRGSASDSNGALETERQNDPINSLNVVFIFLDCSKNILLQRISTRQGHFMKADMLDSQLQTLERPGEEESSYTVVVNGDLELSSIITKVTTDLAEMLG